MTGFANSVTALAVAFGPSIVIKATVTLALTLVVVRVARHSRASVRHLLLTAGFGVVSAVPFAALVAPALPVEVAPVPPALEQYIYEPLFVDGPAPASATAVERRAEAVAPRGNLFTVELVTAAWVAGTFVFALPVLAGLMQVRLLRRRGLPWRAGQPLVDALAGDAGLRRRIDVLLHEGIVAPATCGVRRAAILFPIDADSWSDGDRLQAAVHEIEHVRRADYVVSACARLICAVYWFHPLAWIAWRRLVLEAERACDDAVLRRAEASAYADQLVAIAGRLAMNPRHPLLAMASRSDLVQRVSAVLDARQARGRVGLTAAASVVFAACALIAVISPLQAVSRPSPLSVSGASVSDDPSGGDVLDIARMEPPPADALSRTVATPALPRQTSGSATPGAVAVNSQMPKFDVVSVRPCENVTGRGGGPGRIVPEAGTASWNCQAVHGYIEFAYITWANGRTMQSVIELGTAVEGGPSWLRTERYSIEAKASGPASHAMMSGPMLQALLEDRFKLKVHWETRQGHVPVYALTVAGGGARLRPFQEGSCTHREMTSFPPPPLPPGAVPCRERRQGNGATISMDQQGITLDVFAKWLSFGLDRRVINRTGISGRFDFALEYSLPAMPGGGPALSLPDAPVAPSIHDALRAMGLQLEATNGPQDVLVIDSVEQPSPN